MANTLLRNVPINSTTLRPAQSVFVQANGINGVPLGYNFGATVTIKAIERTARSLQFALPRPMNTVVRAVNSQVDESATSTVAVTGAALTCRRTIGPRATTAIPIIQATLKLGNPYEATLSLNSRLGRERTGVRSMPKTASFSEMPLVGSFPTAPR